MMFLFSIDSQRQHPKPSSSMRKSGLLLLGLLTCWGLSFSSACSNGTGSEMSPEKNSQEQKSHLERSPADTLDGGAPEDLVKETATPEPTPDTAPAQIPLLNRYKVYEPGKESGSTRVQINMDFTSEGKLLLVWTGVGDGNKLGIYQALMDDQGTLTKTPTRVDTYKGGNKIEPQVCSLANGGYVVVWSLDTQSTQPNMEIRYRRFKADGTPLDKESVRIHTELQGNHTMAEVTCDNKGNFFVAGARPDTDNKTFGVFYQSFDSSGKPLDKGNQVNTAPKGTQSQPVIDSANNGNIIVAWEDSVPISSTQNRDQVMFRLFPGGGKQPLPPTVALNNSLGPALSIAKGSGRFAVAGTVSQGKSLAVYEYSADGKMVETLAVPTNSNLIFNPALAALGNTGAYALAYMVKVGPVTSVYVTVIGPDKYKQPAVELGSGTMYGAYKLLIRYHKGKIAVAWTERNASKKFTNKLAIIK